MAGLAREIVSRAENIDLTVCFPYGGQKDQLHGYAHSLEYYSFPQSKEATKYDEKTQARFEAILRQAEPDIIHIWGTEYPHALAMARACEKAGMLRKAVISIQGLCSIYAKHYYANLPQKVVNSYTFRDVLKSDNIKQQRKKFEKRGGMEIEAIRKVNHVIGRTTWDKACASRINPHAEYHFCNEVLREEFYKNQWDIKLCQRHSIFASQGYYPIKGLHMMLAAMPEIQKNYPDAHLYIAGGDITKISVIKRSSYSTYITKLIRRYGLQDAVTFTGALNEEQMCARYLKSHVFVSPSNIENSPNSLGEAMLLGMPCISSAVGGVPDLLWDREEGFLYQYDAPYMLAYYVSALFTNDQLACFFSVNAQKRAEGTHDREKNLKRLLDIYTLIKGKSE